MLPKTFVLDLAPYFHPWHETVDDFSSCFSITQLHLQTVQDLHPNWLTSAPHQAELVYSYQACLSSQIFKCALSVNLKSNSLWYPGVCSCRWTTARLRRENSWLKFCLTGSLKSRCLFLITPASHKTRWSTTSTQQISNVIILLQLNQLKRH